MENTSLIIALIVGIFSVILVSVKISKSLIERKNLKMKIKQEENESPKKQIVDSYIQETEKGKNSIDVNAGSPSKMSQKNKTGDNIIKKNG